MENKEQKVGMSLVFAAKEFAKIPLNRDVDTEERYFNDAVREYDAFIAGASWQSSQPINSGWVSVEERLPDERKGWSNSLNVNLLLRDEVELFVSTGSYSYHFKKWSEHLYNGSYEIIAWMPLPSPPKQ